MRKGAKRDPLSRQRAACQFKSLTSASVQVGRTRATGDAAPANTRAVRPLEPPRSQRTQNQSNAGPPRCLFPRLFKSGKRASGDITEEALATPRVARFWLTSTGSTKTPFKTLEATQRSHDKTKNTVPSAAPRVFAGARYRLDMVYDNSVA